MEHKVCTLALHALRSEDPAIKKVGKEVIEEYANAGYISAIAGKGMILFMAWKNTGEETYLRPALEELRRLPIHYIVEELPRLEYGEEAKEMLYPVQDKGERKRLVDIN